MKIRWHTPYYLPGGSLLSVRHPDPAWPSDWPVPPVGDNVAVGPDRYMLKVHAVDWFPAGEEEGEEPFVYVVLKDN